MPDPKSNSNGETAHTSEASDRATTIQDSPLHESEGPTKEESEAKSETDNNENNETRRSSRRTSYNFTALAGEFGAALAQTAVNVGREAGELGGALATSAAYTAANMRTLASGVSEYTEGMFGPSESVSGRYSKNARTDEASFNQFLDQVIKAHLQSGADGEEPLHRRGMRRNLTGILEGAVSGGFFQKCPKMQAMCYKVCARIENSMLFGLLCWTFLLLHCIALVQVANKQGSPEVWYAISQSYMVFFIFELLVRIAATPYRFFWQSGFVVLDIVLVMTAVVEAILPLMSDQLGQGQFTLLTLHVLRFLRGVQAHMPEAASSVTACFGGLLPIVYFLLLCFIWSFLAVVWYLVFSNNVVEPKQFADFGSSSLNQFYLACNALDWGRITHPLHQAHQQMASILAVIFCVVLLAVSFLTANGTIIVFHELAEKGITDYRNYEESKQMRRRLLGLSRLEQSLQDAARSLGAGGDWAEWLMQSRQNLETALPILQPNLAMLKITANEVLQLYDHLFEVTHGAPTVSELLFGILRMISPSSAAELLQVDHLQKQCVQLSEASMSSMERQLEQGGNHLDDIASSVSKLQLQLTQLRSQASTARQELQQMVVEVEQQYQDCMDSVNQAASIRRLHLQLTHENSRQEVFSQVNDAQRSVANLQRFNRLSGAFGFPPLGREESWSQAHDSDRSFGDNRQFELVANLLQTEVKERIESRLKRYLELQTQSVAGT